MESNINKAILSLPQELSTPSNSLSDYSILLYGREKIGKTSFASRFPDTLFFLFEPGARALSIYKTEILKWSDFLGYVELLKKTDRFKTLVVDTVDLAYRLCYNSVCKKLAIDHPSDESWTAWTMIKDEFSLAMSTILKLGRGVLFISHSTEKEIKRRQGTTSHRIVPTMSKQPRDILEPMVDIWVYCDYLENGEREFVLRGDQDISAGHRLQKNFIGIDRVPMGRNSEEAYKNFLLAFQNKEIPKKSKVVIKK